MSPTVRFVSFGLAVITGMTLALAACARDEEPGGVSSEEQAIVTQSAEDVVDTLDSADALQIDAMATSYSRTWGCATVTTDGLSYAIVTFSGCTGPLQASGTLRFDRSADSTPSEAIYDVTQDMMLRSVSLDGAARLTIPSDASVARTLDGLWTVVGPRGRQLTVDAVVSWVRSGSCATIYATGEITAPKGSATFEIHDKTVCR